MFKTPRCAVRRLFKHMGGLSRGGIYQVQINRFPGLPSAMSITSHDRTTEAPSTPIDTYRFSFERKLNRSYCDVAARVWQLANEGCVAENIIWFRQSNIFLSKKYTRLHCSLYPKWLHSFHFQQSIMLTQCLIVNTAYNTSPKICTRFALCGVVHCCGSQQIRCKRV